MAGSATPARKTLYNDPTFSDIKIRQIYKGQVKEYAAHKAVLCAHSGWFMRALTGQFMEASADTIEVHEDDPEIFQVMMEFFYKMELETESLSSSSSSTVCDKMVPIITLHTLADKYDAKALQSAAASAFQVGTESHYHGLEFKDVAKLIDAHYPFCSTVMGAMSQAIINFILRYGNLGGDLYLLGKAAGKLKVIG